jgi:hypothetical protein
MANTTHALITEAEKFLADRAVFPDPRFLLPLVLWAAHTHCFEACQFDLPYLGFTGVSGSGKNKAMALVGSLCHKFIMPSKSTPAAMRDAVNDARPTLGVEECEDELRKHNSDLHILFNAGYMPGACMTKKVGKDTVQFSIYCPKCMTTISDPEESLRSRTLIVPMSIGNPVNDYPIDTQRPIGNAIGNRLLELIKTHELEIAHAYRSSSLKRPSLLEGRDWQIWRPLFAICHVLLPGRMEELERSSTFCTSMKARPVRTVNEMHLLKANNERVKMSGRLLQDCAAVVKDYPAKKIKNIATEVLKKALLALPHGWWEGYQYTDSQGKGVGLGDPSGSSALAKMLRLASNDTVNPGIHYLAPGKSGHGYVVADILAAAEGLGKGKIVPLEPPTQGENEPTTRQNDKDQRKLRLQEEKEKLQERVKAHTAGKG